MDSGKATEAKTLSMAWTSEKTCAIAAAIEAGSAELTSKYVPPLTLAALCSNAVQPGPWLSGSVTLSTSMV